MNKGIFITIEGPDGSGKTTIIKEIAKRLSDKGINFMTTREPGGIDIAEQIREVILNTKNTAMDGRTEALLYAASRRQHLIERVIPALDEGKIVICDRFVDSSLAYQGYARELGIDEVYSINKFAIEDTMPDVTILLDCSPEIGLDRVFKNQGREVNRLDLEDVKFHDKVYEGYKKIKKLFPNRIKVVDANGSLEDSVSSVWNIINKYI